MINSFRIAALVIIISGIIIGFSLLWSLIKGAPWFPTRMKKLRRMLTLAKIQPDEVVYDLGCGDGRFIVMAARKFKAKAVGIEINFLLFLWCQFLITILGLRKKVKVIYGNLFKQDLGDADVVICYLLQNTNDRLEEKLVKELKSSARVVSNSFMFHGLPLADINTEEGIYVYDIGKDLSI